MFEPILAICLTAIVLYAMRLYEARGRRQVLKLTQEVTELDKRLESTARDLETVRAVGLANGKAIELMDAGLKSHATAITNLGNAQASRQGMRI